MGRQSQALLGDAWWKNERQQTQWENGKFWLNQRKRKMPQWWQNTGIGAQRNCGISILGGVQHFTGPRPELLCLSSHIKPQVCMCSSEQGFWLNLTHIFYLLEVCSQMFWLKGFLFVTCWKDQLRVCRFSSLTYCEQTLNRENRIVLFLREDEGRSSEAAVLLRMIRILGWSKLELLRCTHLRSSP